MEGEETSESSHKRVKLLDFRSVKGEFCLLSIFLLQIFTVSLGFCYLTFLDSVI